MLKDLFPKRLLYLALTKADGSAPETFAEAEDLEKPENVEESQSIEEKMKEADKVFELSRSEFLGKYGATFVPPVTTGSSEAEITQARISIMNRLDTQIDALGDASFRKQIQDLKNSSSPAVENILSEANNFFNDNANEAALGSARYREQLKRNLDRYGLKFDDTELLRKATLAGQIDEKTRDLRDKEAQVQLEKVRLQEIDEERKEIDMRYKEYGGIRWKVFKSLGVITGGVGAASLAAATAPVWALPAAIIGGAVTLGGFVPQLDRFFSNKWNSIKKFWAGAVTPMPRLEREAKREKFDIAKIQTQLAKMGEKETIKRAVFEKDLEGLKTRRTEIVEQIRTQQDELRILPDADKVVGNPRYNQISASIAAATGQMNTVDQAIEHQEKILLLFKLADEQKDKLADFALLNGIVRSKYMPATNKKIMEVLGKETGRTKLAQREIGKLKPADMKDIMSEMTDAELTELGNYITFIEAGVNAKAIDSPAPAMISTIKKNRKPLYKLCIDLMKLPAANRYRSKVKDELKEMKNDTETNIGALRGTTKATVAKIMPPGPGLTNINPTGFMGNEGLHNLIAKHLRRETNPLGETFKKTFANAGEIDGEIGKLNEKQLTALKKVLDTIDRPTPLYKIAADGKVS